MPVEQPDDAPHKRVSWVITRNSLPSIASALSDGELVFDGADGFQPDNPRGEPIPLSGADLMAPTQELWARLDSYSGVIGWFREVRR